MERLARRRIPAENFPEQASGQPASAPPVRFKQGAVADDAALAEGRLRRARVPERDAASAAAPPDKDVSSACHAASTAAMSWQRHTPVVSLRHPPACEPSHWPIGEQQNGVSALLLLLLRNELVLVKCVDDSAGYGDDDDDDGGSGCDCD